jgi:TorA maturation chaperone TorD
VLFEYPSADWRERLTAVAGDVHDARLREAAELAKQQASEGMHHSIFGPGGPVPAREATYTNGVQLGYLLAELNAFYQAFAYAPQVPEAADHIAVETGFLAYLCMKQAYALACGSSTEAELAKKAAVDFLHEHLRTMAGPIACALEAVAAPYLVLAGRVLLDRTGPRDTPIPRQFPECDDDACGIDSAANAGLTTLS